MSHRCGLSRPEGARRWMDLFQVRVGFRSGVFREDLIKARGLHWALKACVGLR